MYTNETCVRCQQRQLHENGLCLVCKLKDRSDVSDYTQLNCHVGHMYIIPSKEEKVG